MNSDFSPNKDDLKSALRKLRKKLRQIETLEKTSRPLTPEESAKLQSKEDCRESLSNLLKLATDFNVSASGTPQSSQSSAHNMDHDPPLSLSPVCLMSDQLELPDDSLAEIKSITEEESFVEETKPQISDTIQTASCETTDKPSTDNTPDHLTCETYHNESRKRKRDQSSRRHQVLSFKKLWRSCEVRYLNKHHDNVCSVSADKGTLISGSKDTTAVSWADNGDALFTLGAHTSTVTGCFITEHGIITTSYDCNVRAWSAETGKLLSTHYLFSPITAAAEHGGMLLLGTEGGKLMYYSLKSSQVTWERVAHDECVVNVYLGGGGDIAISASTRPDIKIWRVSDSSLVPLSYNITPTRTVRCSLVHDNKVYFGDDGINIKIYDLQSETLDKIKNHDSDYGSTDAMLIYKDTYLLASSYNLDTGESSINFRLLPAHSYLFSIECPVYGPITCLSCDMSRDSPFLMYGACDLGIIAPKTEHGMERNETDFSAIKVLSLASYQDMAADSVSECWSSSDDEDDDDDIQARKSQRIDEDEQPGSGCTVM